VLGVKLSFMPYHYGPWSYEVNEALSALADAGLLGMDAEVRERIDGAPFSSGRTRGAREPGRPRVCTSQAPRAGAPAG